jgi:hypothetical protein
LWIFAKRIDYRDEKYIANLFLSQESSKRREMLKWVRWQT